MVRPPTIGGMKVEACSFFFAEALLALRFLPPRVLAILAASKAFRVMEWCEKFVGAENDGFGFYLGRGVESGRLFLVIVGCEFPNASSGLKKTLKFALSR